MMASSKPLPLYCDVCQKSFSGPVPAEAHYYSASHKQKQLISERTDAPGFKCSICNVPCSSEEAYAEHKRSPRHEEIAKRAIQREPAADVSCQPASKRDNVGSSTQKHYIYNGKIGICYVCGDLPLNSPQHAIQHINGKAHKHRVSAIEFRKEEAKMAEVEERIQRDGSLAESGNYSRSHSESSSTRAAENMVSRSQSQPVESRDGNGSASKSSSTNVKDEPTSPEMLGYAFNGVQGYCYLCKVHMTSEKLGNEHIKGNKHRRMFTLHMDSLKRDQPDSTKTSEPVLMKEPNIPESVHERILEKPTDEQKRKDHPDYVFFGTIGYCFLCQVEFPSKTKHLLEANHIRAQENRMRDETTIPSHVTESCLAKEENFVSRESPITNTDLINSQKVGSPPTNDAKMCGIGISSPTSNFMSERNINCEMSTEEKSFYSSMKVEKIENRSSPCESPEITLYDYNDLKDFNECKKNSNFNEEESTNVLQLSTKGNNIEVDSSSEITETSSVTSELSVISSKENDDLSIQSLIYSKRDDEESDESMIKVPSSKFCDICKVRYTSDEQTQAHLNGQKHKRAVKRLDLPTDSSCSLCNMDFSGPEPLQQHLEGSKHKKELQNQKSKEIAIVNNASNVTTEAKSPIADESDLKLSVNVTHNEESLIQSKSFSDKGSSELCSSEKDTKLEKASTTPDDISNKLETTHLPVKNTSTALILERNKSEILERPLEEIKQTVNLENGEDASTSDNKMVLPEITENSPILNKHGEPRILEGSIDDVEIVPNRKGTTSKSRLQIKKLPNRSSKKSSVKKDRSLLDSTSSSDNEEFVTCKESLEKCDVQIGISEKAGTETSALCTNLSPGADPIVEKKTAHAVVSPTDNGSDRIESLEISDVEIRTSNQAKAGASAIYTNLCPGVDPIFEEKIAHAGGSPTVNGSDSIKSLEISDVEIGTIDQAKAAASEICTNVSPGVEPIFEKKIAHAAESPTITGTGNDGNNRLFPQFRYYCEICNKPANTKEAFESHLKGKIHKNRVSTSSVVPEQRQHFELEKLFNYDINSEMNLMTEIPRKYQKEIFVKAMKADSICFLPTGTGKTRIAAMLINQMLRENPSRQVLFLVDKVLLGMQQGKVFEKLLEGKTCTRFTDACGEFEERTPTVEVLSGGQQSSGVPLWKVDVIVATAAYCINLLMKKALRWTDFSLVILDEAHHCIGEHPYNKVMKEYHCRLHHTEQPKVIGLTASPAGQSTLESTRRMLANLQRNLGGAKVAIVERYVSELNLYKSNAELVLKRITLSAPEKEFLEVLRLYMAQCYCLLYRHNPEKFSNMLELNFNLLYPEKLVPYLSGETLATLQYGLEMYQFDNDMKTNQKLRRGGLLYHAKAICRAVTAMDDAGISCALDELSPLLAENKYGSFDIVEVEGLDSRKLIHLMKVYGCMDENRANPATNQTSDDAGANNNVPLESHVVKLVRELTNYKYINWQTNENMPMALVLVKTRRDARFYCEKLRVTPIIKELGLNVIYLIGHGAAAMEKGMDVKKQRIALDEIQANKYQIIVATSVAEEGIDLPECEIVIAMSVPTSVTALVQMRGRARKKDSYFIVMCKSEVEEAKVTDMLNKERNIEIASRELAEKD